MLPMGGVMRTRMHSDCLVLVTSTGGDYGKYLCPSCEAMSLWKYDTGFGWCNDCGEQLLEESVLNKLPSLMCIVAVSVLHWGK